MQQLSPGYGTDQVLREVSRHGHEQRRSRTARTHHGDGARRARLDPLVLGDAVLSDRGQAERHVLHSPDRRGRVGRVRERRSELSDLDRLLLGQRRPKCRRWRSPATRRVPTSCCRPRCRTAIVISDLPGPTGGIMLKSTTGATHHRQRHRHLHPERQGREHRHDRARRHRQQRRAGGDLKEDDDDARIPSSRRRDGDVRAWRTGAADRAEPARARERTADRRR